jgi:hypothetical protein
MEPRHDIEPTVSADRIPARYARFCLALGKRLREYNAGLQHMPGPHSDQLIRFVRSVTELKNAVMECLTDDERDFLREELQAASGCEFCRSDM